MNGLAGASLSDWMVDTFVYTGVLIALVLLVRKPVARHFGPQIAYALWALPLLRLIMPPIVLPAWMRPAEAGQGAGAANEPLMVLISDPAAADAAIAAPAVGIGVTDLLLPLWLGGATVFMAWRARDYVRMRRDLLADARPVGEAGKVRLVEIPAVRAPVAFGIIDRVVALPLEFMDRIDVQARDMAIAHELEHHRGHDLLANIAAQPLLALHWFNPLAWWGWRAMRRDQEAACDARVVAGQARSERARYAEVIAGFAAGEHLALAAPMACPVLGEKSIIHRLRSLTMTDISPRRRRIGIAALATTALALPLTASISYAAPDLPEPSESDAYAEATPVVETVADQDWQQTQEVVVDDMQDGEERVIVRVIQDEDGEREVIRRIIRRNGGETQVLEGEAADRAIERSERLRERTEHLSEQAVESAREAREAAEEARVAAAHGRAMGEYGRRMGEHGRRIGAQARRTAMEASRLAVVTGEFADELECNGEDVTVERQLSDGRRAIMICQSGINAAQIEGMRAALEAMRDNPGIPPEAREDAIEAIEDAIEELEEMRAASFGRQGRMVPPTPPTPPRVGARLTAPLTPHSGAVMLRTEARFIQMRPSIFGRAMIHTRDDDCAESASTHA
ncbi:M56 family metallopeptidase [Aurantiacibacter aquimixticola]|uniref:Peptidase M56 domain-containing protein n=1 Tax=Aurantiacibacter aquimixticola TaxID=1958945 RepID=A0A419RSK0_9SPHN|nr:M56 family metallopeptidase [Aurantiacibacter aquimixticola]RJY08758.1 hypothetical protein D6201_04745 [Aurantiacibacter aquimixticola]